MSSQCSQSSAAACNRPRRRASPSRGLNRPPAGARSLSSPWNLPFGFSVSVRSERGAEERTARARGALRSLLSPIPIESVRFGNRIHGHGLRRRCRRQRPRVGPRRLRVARDPGGGRFRRGYEEEGQPAARRGYGGSHRLTSKGNRSLSIFRSVWRLPMAAYRLRGTSQIQAEYIALAA